MPYLLSHINVLLQELSHQHPINIIISSQVVRYKKVDAHLRSNLLASNCRLSNCTADTLAADGLTALQNTDNLAAEGLTALQIP